MRLAPVRSCRWVEAAILSARRFVDVVAEFLDDPPPRDSIG
jgi:hypothetical protein